jgi:predicted amidohydrolase YtcJ
MVNKLLKPTLFAVLTITVFTFTAFINSAVAQKNVINKADYVLQNGEIYNVDAMRSWADALAIKNNKIIYIGLDKGVKDYIGKQTKVIDLKGKMVLPGFQDSHIHPVGSALNSYMCSLLGLASIDAYLDKIKQCVAAHPNATWIHGAGWSHRVFQDLQPDKKMLDKIVSHVPFTLHSYDGHSLWANSKALEVAGVDEKTKDVAAGKVLRYPNSNEPMGIFLEDPAAELVMYARPAYTQKQVYGALLYVQKYLNSLGITSVQDALIAIDGEEGIYGTIDAYHEADKKNELTIRVTGALYWNPTKGMEQAEKMKRYREKYSFDKFRVTSVKIWQDGVMHTHTSHLLEGYKDKPNETGLVMIEQPRLNELVVEMDKAGFQMHFHADGDAALRQCLDAIELALKTNGKADNRHQIAHLELVHPDDIPRFRELNVVANVQPIWSTSKSYISDLINVKIGEKRKRWLEINKSFLDEGIIVAYGSDWNVTTPKPVDLIEAAVTRISPTLSLEEKRNSTPLLPDENVNVADAIASYTINGAYVNHQNKTTGSLEVGKLADIVVLDKNLFDVEPVRISETKVLLTFMDGKLVFGQLPLK